MSEVLAADKGGQMEEVLRDYFLELGYFVIRGARYFYMENEITDVDLWLYQRASLFSRQRINVDVKAKRIPQALERVLWTKGLQMGLRFDGSIVATTDTREAVRHFGELQSVAILDGRFLTKLKGRYGKAKGRMMEEELQKIVRLSKGDRIGTDWLERLDAAKGVMLTQLNFDGCNSLLNDARYYIEQMLVVPHRAECACRLFYATLAYVLIAIDFVTREFSFSEKNLQSERLNDGFRFGTAGQKVAEKVFAIAARLLSTNSRSNNARSNDVAKQLRAEADSLRVEILTEFVLKTGNRGSVFDMARNFEWLVYLREFVSPSDLEAENKAFVGALLDFFEIDRRRFFDTFPNLKGKPSTKPTNSSAVQLEMPVPAPSPDPTDSGATEKAR